MARKRYDIVNTKAEREGRKISQNAFVDNKFALQLAENTQLRGFVESNGDIWEQKAEFVKNLLLEMQEDETVKSDVASGYEDSKAMWKQLYKKHIQDNESLNDILESESLYWNGDKDIIDTCDSSFKNYCCFFSQFRGRVEIIIFNRYITHFFRQSWLHQILMPHFASLMEHID